MKKGREEDGKLANRPFPSSPSWAVTALAEGRKSGTSESPAGATRASPVDSSQEPPERGAGRGFKLLTAVALLSNQGTRVPNRSHYDSLI